MTQSTRSTGGCLRAMIADPFPGELGEDKTGARRIRRRRGLAWCSRNAGQRTLGQDGGNGLPGGVRLYIVELP
jgi:hypothetical protein